MLTLALVFTLASWIAGGLSLWLVSPADTIDEAILRVVFIGLAALTVPHMILVDGMFRRIRQPFKV
jgi:O-antigen/teichoic acid export membrane protein